MEISKRLMLLPAKDKRGIALCREALELYRGEFMEYTEEAPWLSAYRAAYSRQLSSLARDTLARTAIHADDSLTELLCRRAAALIPEDEELHRALLARLMEQRRDILLVRYAAQLSRAGDRAKWLEGNF